ncbi:MAG TPA: L-aspartate oxidase [Coxiellaceae bacterium]|nr:L-aspartate oxidase [Coxiellaceae bacterium]
MLPTKNYDVLIIGSGAAGLGLALSLADQCSIALVSKASLHEGSSQHAQGGIAAVMDQAEDSYENHIQDTLIAGAGLCHSEVVRFTVEHAKEAIEWLITQGVQFTGGDKQALHLTREGGHSHRRIVHVADKTGSAVVNTLAEQAYQHPNIDCFSEHTVMDLCVDKTGCQGAWVFNNLTAQLTRFNARITALATGGASRCYIHTTNPEQTSGDGIAMAWRAGCRIANLEFNQFHPTCLYHPSAPTFLISEALRGEGAHLVLANGHRFMLDYDERAELAPRDIVARAIDTEMKKNKLAHVYLDISHQPASTIKRLFPTIYRQCLSLGFDLTRQAIPVVPAAHYTCGGVMTNLAGQTDIKKLYAVGEVAFTGLHGANRMASNSLLECLVFAASASRAIQQELSKTTATTTERINIPHFQDEINPLDLSALSLALRQSMWNNFGIVRNNHDMQESLNFIKNIQAVVEQQFYRSAPSKAMIELRNLVEVCVLSARCALTRKESRGLHFNIDYPNLLSKAEDTVLQQNSLQKM